MKRQFSPKRKLIVIWTLAIILPIIILIVFEYISLSNIKSTHAIDAVIQRDFMQTLEVVERKSSAELKIYARSVADELGATDLSQTPDAAIHAKVDATLEHFPFTDAIFYFDSRRGLVMNDRQSLETHMECDFLRYKKALMVEMLRTEQFHESVRKLQEYALRGEFKLIPTAVRRNEHDDVNIVVYFVLPPYDDDSYRIGGYILDTPFLANEFFPRIFREMESESTSGDRRNLKSTIIAIHYINEEQNIIASSQPIDSYNFEVKRIMGYGAWRFFVAAIKPKGVTIEGIADHYIRWNFLLVTFLVVVLIGGMLLTLRNMAREMQLAQLKSDFVSNVSHEFKTPLALIRLFAETLELDRVKSTERQREYFSIIRKESERLTQLINNILDFSRIEAGKKEYKFVRQSISEVVRETIESYRFHVEQQGFTLKMDTDDTLPPMRIDRDAISQAMLNLLNNSLKYSTDEKSITVTVSREGQMAKIMVADRGIGIARADQKKIFEKFYRASNSLVHDTKGSGLGLSLVHHIVKAHGGTIKVESRVGEGSRFVIQLPLPEPGTGEWSASDESEESHSTTAAHTENVA
ncbi:MAG: HAMP domain-containing histidine kinase [Acidobacteriia bacterium]|nr:HAMP domain-containing histidine kinase [Terriglobia bacterium]